MMKMAVRKDMKLAKEIIRNNKNMIERKKIEDSMEGKYTGK